MNTGLRMTTQNIQILIEVAPVISTEDYRSRNGKFSSSAHHSNAQPPVHAPKRFYPPRRNDFGNQRLVPSWYKRVTTAFLQRPVISILALSILLNFGTIYRLFHTKSPPPSIPATTIPISPPLHSSITQIVIVPVATPGSPQKITIVNPPSGDKFGSSD